MSRSASPAGVSTRIATCPQISRAEPGHRKTGGSQIDAARGASAARSKGLLAYTPLVSSKQQLPTPWEANGEQLSRRYSATVYARAFPSGHVLLLASLMLAALLLLQHVWKSKSPAASLIGLQFPSLYCATAAANHVSLALAVSIAEAPTLLLLAVVSPLLGWRACDERVTSWTAPALLA